MLTELLTIALILAPQGLGFVRVEVAQRRESVVVVEIRRGREETCCYEAA